MSILEAEKSLTTDPELSTAAGAGVDGSLPSGGSGPTRLRGGGAEGRAQDLGSDQEVPGRRVSSRSTGMERCSPPMVTSDVVVRSIAADDVLATLTRPGASPIGAVFGSGDTLAVSYSEVAQPVRVWSDWHQPDSFVDIGPGETSAPTLSEIGAVEPRWRSRRHRRARSLVNDRGGEEIRNKQQRSELRRCLFGRRPAGRTRLPPKRELRYSACWTPRPAHELETDQPRRAVRTHVAQLFPGWGSSGRGRSLPPRGGRLPDRSPCMAQRRLVSGRLPTLGERGAVAGRRRRDPSRCGCGLGQHDPQTAGPPRRHWSSAQIPGRMQVASAGSEDGETIIFDLGNTPFEVGGFTSSISEIDDMWSTDDGANLLVKMAAIHRLVSSSMRSPVT